MTAKKTTKAKAATAETKTKKKEPKKQEEELSPEDALVAKVNKKNEKTGEVIDPDTVNNTEARFDSSDAAARQPEVTGPEQNKPGAGTVPEQNTITPPKVTHSKLREFISRLRVGPENDAVIGFVTNSGNHVGLGALSDNQLLDAHQRSLGANL